MTTPSHYIIEYLVLGAATIMFIYHTILYFLQKDRFLILYSHYLLSLTVNLVFIVSTQHYSFEPAKVYWYFIADDFIILWMLFSYVYFIAQVFEIENNAPLIKFAVFSFYFCIAISLLLHFYKIFFTELNFNTREYFFFTKLLLATFAFMGIFGSFYIRKNIFVRIITFGAFIYAFFGLLTMISIYWGVSIIGLREYQLYFIGCFLDVLIFSSALGYRSITYYLDKIVAQNKLKELLERNETLLKEKQGILERDNSLKKDQELMNYQLQNDVIAGLSCIKIYAELINLNENDQVNTTLIENITNTSLKSMNDISDIIWISNENENITSNLLIRIKNICFKYFSEYNIIFRVESYLCNIDLKKEDVKSILDDVRKNIIEVDYSSKKVVVIKLVHIENTNPKIFFEYE